LEFDESESFAFVAFLQGDVDVLDKAVLGEFLPEALFGNAEGEVHYVDSRVISNCSILVILNFFFNYSSIGHCMCLFIVFVFVFRDFFLFFDPF
jgi:hypothetical protein